MRRPWRKGWWRQWTNFVLTQPNCVLAWTPILAIKVQNSWLADTAASLVAWATAQLHTLGNYILLFYDSIRLKPVMITFMVTPQLIRGFVNTFLSFNLLAFILSCIFDGLSRQDKQVTRQILSEVGKEQVHGAENACSLVPHSEF